MYCILPLTTDAGLGGAAPWMTRGWGSLIAMDNHMQAQFSSSPLLETVHSAETKEEIEKKSCLQIQLAPAACGQMFVCKKLIHVCGV